MSTDDESESGRKDRERFFDLFARFGFYPTSFAQAQIMARQRMEQNRLERARLERFREHPVTESPMGDRIH